MSTNLQQATKQSRVSTLPDDLKAIAEAMLAEKFGEEAIEVKSQGPFPGGDTSPFRSIRRDDFFVEPGMGYSRGNRHRDLGEVNVRIEPWSRDRVAEMEITYPSYDVLMAAFRQVRERGIRPQSGELILNPEFYNFLMRDREVHMAYQSRDMDPRRGRTGVKDPDGYLFGCEVYITPKVRHAMLITRF